MVVSSGDVPGCQKYLISYNALYDCNVIVLEVQQPRLCFPVRTGGQPVFSGCCMILEQFSGGEEGAGSLTSQAGAVNNEESKCYKGKHFVTYRLFCTSFYLISHAINPD